MSRETSPFSYALSRTLFVGSGGGRSSLLCRLSVLDYWKVFFCEGSKETHHFYYVPQKVLMHLNLRKPSPGLVNICNVFTDRQTEQRESVCDVGRKVGCCLPNEKRISTGQKGGGC